MEYTIFGLTFHAYGFILGLAMLIAGYLVTIKAKKAGLSEACLEKLFVWALFSGVIGARMWHVATDYWLYLDSPWLILQIWNGGLSIFGGLVGGMVGLWLGLKLMKDCQRFSLISILDLAVFGLPFGQAIGRWGNYINQELFGWPTSLPWGIFISPERRPPGLESYSHFHPLFLYEMLAMLIFGLAIWWKSGWFASGVRENGRVQDLREAKKASQAGIKAPPWEIGSGWYVAAYILFYSALRFGLDFLRPDTPRLAGLGINQLVMLVVVIVVGCWWVWKLDLCTQIYRKKTWLIALIMSALLLGAYLLANSGASQFGRQISPMSRSAQEIVDRQQLTLYIEEQALEVEVVSSPTSIAQGLSGRNEIGSDGMLFIFEEPRQAVFWMKDMLFDLDLVWIAGGQVVGVSAHVPAPSLGTLERDLPRYPSPGAVEMVLELPAGWAEERGISPGSSVRLDVP
jgi:phosphatidylglycerol---prolipoprotein diacylglyceryl transferase